MRDNVNQKKTEKRRFKTKEKKREQLHFNLLIFSLVFCILNLMFIESKTIGGDNRYEIYVFLVPTVIGTLFFGIYRKDYILNKYSSFKETYAKTVVIGFYLLQGILVSYLSFGQIASVLWNCFNKIEAKKNPTEIIICKVTDFDTRKNPTVCFKFKNKTEVFRVNSEVNKANYDRNPKDYQLEIAVKKGIWNYYIVEHWKLSKIR